MVTSTCLEQLKMHLHTKTCSALYRQETGPLHYELLEGREWVLFIFLSITQSMPWGTYSQLGNTCWKIELNQECTVMKYFLHSPFFCIWVSIWICKTVQVLTSYIYSHKLCCLGKQESLGQTDLDSPRKKNTHPSIVSALENKLHT